MQNYGARFLIHNCAIDRRGYMFAGDIQEAYEVVMPGGSKTPIARCVMED
jgi:hypothetical protein